MVTFVTVNSGNDALIDATPCALWPASLGAESAVANHMARGRLFCQWEQ